MQKLKDNVVTLAKADNDVKAVTFTGDESELSVTGAGETSIKEFSFVKKGGAIEPKRMRIIITLKTNDEINTATAKIYLNGEVAARTEFSSTSLTYELKSDDFDISDLASGKHLVSLKLKSSDELGIVYSDYLDVLLVK